MRMKYADFDECPVSIEMTMRELEKLLQLIQDAEGPFRRLKKDLAAARREALESAVNAAQYELNRLGEDKA